MKLIIVRHGETYANAEAKVMQGHLDSDLTPKGIKQINALSEFLKNRKIDVIYSSDLIRAKRTAEAINKFHNKKIIYNKILRERNFGIYEGKSKEEFNKETKKSGLKFYEFTPEEGESLLEVGERVLPYIKEIIKINKDKIVLLVSHGGLIMEIYSNILKIPWEEFRKHLPTNCAVTTLEFGEDGSCKILEMNTNSLPEEIKDTRKIDYL